MSWMGTHHFCGRLQVATATLGRAPAAISNALTEASRDTCDAQMAKMLRDLGHVIHLIQDLSQPGHVRNDNHAKKKHIEAYGLRNIATLPFPRGSLDWRGAGFTQLEDLWNRKLYTRTGGPQPLNADYAARNGLGVATARLGLAEFTNGNLLSEDALYVEAVKDKALHGFPHPSLDASTDVAQVLAGLPATAQRTFLPDQTFGSQFFLAKVADGIPVAKHAVLSYTAVKSLQKVGKIKIGISIKDDKVLEEYHSIMLPNAIQYSAGCLDYFFRGSIGIDVWRWTGEPDFRVAVSNSGTGPLVGGKFELFWDDAAGVRTKIMEWGNTRLPAANETATPAQRHSTRTFTKPPGFQAKSFTVVYKGTINVTKNPPADDLVDQDIAIAAARCSFPMGECVPSTVAFSDVIPGADTAYPLNGSYGLHEEGFGPPDTVNRNIPPGPLREHFFEVTENLNNSPSWQALGTFTLTNAVNAFTDTGAVGRPRRFYRALIAP